MTELEHTSAPTRPHTRSSLACLQCRSKHVKCDAKQPHCTRCSTLQKQCQYTTSRRGGLDRAALSERRRRLAKKSDSQANDQTAQVSTDTTIPELDVDFINCPDISLCDGNLLGETGSFGVQANPPAQSDLVEDPLVLSYYKNFHVLHPFTLPQHHFVKICEGPSTSSYNFATIVPIMRLIGSLYDTHAWSTNLQNEIESLISKHTSSDPVLVQCRLLYSIALFWNNHAARAKEEMDSATTIALELGMHKKEFADMHGEGDGVLMESWRRTWWMLYIVDAYYAGTLGTMNLKAFHIEATVDLPCEEDEYESGMIPEPLTVEDFNSREFADDDVGFSSFAYLIGAVRAAALAISVTPKRASRQDSERVIQSADSIIDAWLLLLPKDRRVMRSDGSIDELMFQAQMLVHVATIGLHRPLSDLMFNPIENLSSCAREAPKDLPRPDLINVHTTRILKSIDAQIQLLALPVRPFHHTPFTTCMVSEGTLSLLSACKYLLRDQELAVARDKIRLTIGCLRTLGEVWTRTAKNVREIQTIARHVLGLENRSAVPGGSELPSLTTNSEQGSSQSEIVPQQEGDAVVSLGSLDDICGWINIGTELNFDWTGEGMT